MEITHSGAAPVAEIVAQLVAPAGTAGSVLATVTTIADAAGRWSFHNDSTRVLSNSNRELMSQSQAQIVHGVAGTYWQITEPTPAGGTPTVWNVVVAGAAGTIANVAALPAATAVTVTTPQGPGTGIYAPAAAVILTPSGDTTGATDTANIQAALNAAWAAGGGPVFLGPASPTNPFWIIQILLRSMVSLFGFQRQATCLKAPVGQAAGKHVVALFDNTTYDYGLYDLTIDGGNGPTTTGAGLQANAFDGIHIDPSSGTGTYGPYSGDNMGTFKRLFVVNFSGSGIYQATKAQEIRFRNVYAENCLVNGWNLNGWDTFISDCTAGNSGEHGWNFGSGAQAYQVSNCKRWSSGQHVASGHQNDFNIGGSYNSLAGCYSEGALAYGFSVSGTTNRVRGYATGSAAAPLDIFQAVDCDVDITAGALNDSFEPNYLVRTDGAASTGTVTVRGTLSDYHTLPVQTVTACPNLKLTIGSSDGGSQAVPYSATVTPNIIKGNSLTVGTLTGAITIANPFVGWQGATLRLLLPQDATGGRVVTFGANYKTAGAVPTTASTTTTIGFVCDSGGVWHETGRATA